MGIRMRIPILYQDEDIVVVDKPVGIPTHAAEPGDPYPGDAVRIVQAQLGLTLPGHAPAAGRRHLGRAAVRRAARRPTRRWRRPSRSAPCAKCIWRSCRQASPAGRASIDAPIVREHDGRYGVTTRQGPAGADGAHALPVLSQGRPTGASACSRSSRRRGAATRSACTWPRSACRCWATGSTATAPAPAPVPARVPTHPAAPGQWSDDDLHGPPAGAVRAGERRGSRCWVRPNAGHGRRGSGDPPAAALRELLALAIARRAPLAADPATTIYRLVNGAGGRAAGPHRGPLRRRGSW